MGDAIAEIQVDQALIRDTRLPAKSLEVDKHVLAQADRHLPLQLLGVWVLPADHRREVVFFPRFAPPE